MRRVSGGERLLQISVNGTSQAGWGWSGSALANLLKKAI